MRILIVGGSGTVGQAAAKELAKRHEIVRAGRSSGDLTVDVMNDDSVKAMYAKLGQVDAIVTCVGHVHFGPVATMSPVNLVLLGMNNVNDNGSFTLTSGILDRDPVRQGANAAAVNGAIGGFVKGAAIEMPRGIRINAVSPGLLEESAVKYDGFFPGHETVSAARVGLAYAKSVDGALTGQVISVG